MHLICILPFIVSFKKDSVVVYTKYLYFICPICKKERQAQVTIQLIEKKQQQM